MDWFPNTSPSLSLVRLRPRGSKLLATTVCVSEALVHGDGDHELGNFWVPVLDHLYLMFEVESFKARSAMTSFPPQKRG